MNETQVAAVFWTNLLVGVGVAVLALASVGLAALALARGRTVVRAVADTARDLVEWVRVPQGLHFHRGHAWVGGPCGGVVRVGMDDFATRLIGPIDGVDLPTPGTRLVQGETGFTIRVGERAVPVLSPVDGEVVRVNADAVRAPGIVGDDPFGGGWLVEVRPERLAADRTNLLTGTLARRFFEDAVADLRARIGSDLGPVLQDGGTPVRGIARAIAGDGWERLVRDHLLVA